MAKLLYIDHENKEKVVKLKPGTGDIIVGRSQACNIYTNNLSVSRNHGKFSFEDGHYIYIDLGSVNGTQINEKQVKRAFLRDGDIIKCGDFIIKFYEDAEDRPRTLQEKLPIEEKRERIEKKTVEKEKFEKKEETPSTEHLHKLIREKDKEIDRLSKELDNLRQEVIKYRKEETHRIGDMESFSEVLEKQKKDTEEKQREINSLHNIIEGLERKLSELETRNTRLTVEMDSITEKYVQLKGQIYHQNILYNEAKQSLSDKDDIIFEYEQKIKELSSQIETARAKNSEQSEFISNLKIKLTHKEREIEDLKRQIDLSEYELRNLREEMENFQSSFNKDGGVQAELERKCNLLREVIAEKENVISELRLELEEKDREIKEVRIGVGIADLEEEKKKILMDYYQKNREVDELKDKIKSIMLEKEESIRKIEELKGEIENLKSQKEDIFSHPEYKKKVRENEKLSEEKIALEKEVKNLEEKLLIFSPEEKAKLEMELEILRRRNVSLGEKLQSTTRQIQAISDDEIFKYKDIKERFSKNLLNFEELVEQWKGNISALKTFLKDAHNLINILKRVNIEEIPYELKSLIAKEEIMENLFSLEDILKVLGRDMEEIEKSLQKFHSLFP